MPSRVCRVCWKGLQGSGKVLRRLLRRALRRCVDGRNTPFRRERSLLHHLQSLQETLFESFLGGRPGPLGDSPGDLFFHFGGEFGRLYQTGGIAKRMSKACHIWHIVHMALELMSVCNASHAFPDYIAHGTIMWSSEVSKCPCH